MPDLEALRQDADMEEAIVELGEKLKTTLRPLYSLFSIYGKLRLNRRPMDLSEADTSAFGGFAEKDFSARTLSGLTRAHEWDRSKVGRLIIGVCEGAYREDGGWRARYDLKQELQAVWKAILDDQAMDQRLGGHHAKEYADLVAGYERLYRSALSEW